MFFDAVFFFSSVFAGAEGKCKYLEGLTRFHGQKINCSSQQSFSI